MLSEILAVLWAKGAPTSCTGGSRHTSHVFPTRSNPSEDETTGWYQHDLSSRRKRAASGDLRGAAIGSNGFRVCSGTVFPLLADGMAGRRSVHTKAGFRFTSFCPALRKKASFLKPLWASGTDRKDRTERRDPVVEIPFSYISSRECPRWHRSGGHALILIESVVFASNEEGANVWLEFRRRLETQTWFTAQLQSKSKVEEAPCLKVYVSHVFQTRTLALSVP